MSSDVSLPGRDVGVPPDDDAPVVFTPTSDGVAVVDVVERHRYAMSASRAGRLRSVDADELLFPVDGAVELTAGHLAFEDVPSMYVRDGDGEMLATTEPVTELSFPAGQYYIEVCGSVKVYLRVEGPLVVTSTRDGKRVEFGGEQRVLMGARSKHERPAGTVTTTARPVDVMAAISTFGSALKTTSPERSFPTLRGHPPTVEVGDERSIPDGLAPPDTGVTIEVPRDLRHVLPVASLAHYLGAEVVPGERPVLRTTGGVDHDLAPDGAFEREVERVLKRCFLLDCAVRTEGLYDVDLAERRAVERAVDLEFGALYDRPLAERLATYLSVPHDAVEPHVPDWKLTTHVAPDVDAVETLPFLVNELAVVRTERPAGPSDGAGAATAGGLAEDSATDAERTTQEDAVDSFLRSTQGATATSSSPVVPTPTFGSDSMERAWVGEGVPRGVSKAVPHAYRNRLARSPAEGDVDITVVYNDLGMANETSVVRGTYGDGNDLPFDVTLHTTLGVEELRDVLAGESSFLHYVGHIDDDGFECVDGTLDASTLESTGVDSFLLNACSSYEQGMALVEAGAAGGIVTLADVVNDSAVKVGSAVARLLNDGYPLRPALDIARRASYVGDDYVVLGDGNLAVAQGAHRCLVLYRIERHGDQFDVAFHNYTTTTGGMGTMVVPFAGINDRYYLTPGVLDTFRVGRGELAEILAGSAKPVLVGRELYWTDELDVETVETLLAG